MELLPARNQIVKGNNMKWHIWRYDTDTPNEERPWIASLEGTCEPRDFETHDEAIAFVATDYAYRFLMRMRTASLI